MGSEASGFDSEVESGLTGMTSYAISQAVKVLQAVIALNEGVSPLEQKCRALESSVGGYKEVNRALQASVGALEKRAAAAEGKLKKVEGLLEKERAVSQELRDGIDLIEKKMVLITHRRAMIGILKGDHRNPREEIDKCTAALEELSGEFDYEEDEGDVCPGTPASMEWK